MTEKETVVTEEGLRKLESELEELKTVHRKEVNDRIRQAKEFGDISENAEYEDAKQEQAFIEGRIMKLEAMIRNAKIIHEGEGGADEVHLGSTVKVKNMSTGSENEYTIVGSAESDPPHRTSSDLLHPLVRPVERAENATCLFEEDLARDRQRDAPGGPIEQLGSNFFLE